MEFTRAYTNALNSAIITRPSSRQAIFNRHAVEDDWYGFGYIEITNPHKEIPTIALTTNTQFEAGPQIVNLKLLNRAPILRRTADSIIKDFFGILDRREGEIVKCVTHKNEIFYGGAGIILDKNKNLLLYITIDKENKILNINISPDALFRKDMVSKSIVGKVSQFYMSKPHHWYDNNRLDGNLIPQVHIKSLAGIIKHPTPPQHGVLEALPNVLIDNIDEIMRNL